MDQTLQFQFTSHLQDADAIRLRRKQRLSEYPELTNIAFKPNSVLINYLINGLSDLSNFNPSDISTNLRQFYINYNSNQHQFEVSQYPNPLMFHRQFTQASLINPEAIIETLQNGMTEFLNNIKRKVNFETERNNFIVQLWLMDLDQFLQVYLGNAQNYLLVQPAHLIAQTALPSKKIELQIKHDLNLNTDALVKLRNNPKKMKALLHQEYPHLDSRYIQDLVDLLTLI